MLYFISSTLNTVFFGHAPPKPYQNHHITGRIRTLKTRIRIGEKTQIHHSTSKHNTANPPLPPPHPEHAADYRYLVFYY